MKNQVYEQNVEGSKVSSIIFLYSMSIVIIILGIAFSVYSFVYDVHFTVLTSSIHGAIFGLIVVFLGTRYFISVNKLKKEVYKATSKFSLNNFRKKKCERD